jgi:translation initiation factor 1A
MYNQRFKGRPSNKKKSGEEEEIVRVRTPRNNEVFGIVEQRLGGSRMSVRCLDGKTRNCRIPGRLKRRLWVREGDIVLVEPWEFEQEKKGDVIFVYKKNQLEWLNSKGFLKGFNSLEEF